MCPRTQHLEYTWARTRARTWTLVCAAIGSHTHCTLTCTTHALSCTTPSHAHLHSQHALTACSPAHSLCTHLYHTLTCLHHTLTTCSPAHSQHEHLPAHSQHAHLHHTLMLICTLTACTHLHTHCMLACTTYSHTCIHTQHTHSPHHTLPCSPTHSPTPCLHTHNTPTTPHVYAQLHTHPHHTLARSRQATARCSVGPACPLFGPACWTVQKPGEALPVSPQHSVGA